MKNYLSLSMVLVLIFLTSCSVFNTASLETYYVSWQGRNVKVDLNDGSQYNKVSCASWSSSVSSGNSLIVESSMTSLSCSGGRSVGSVVTIPVNVENAKSVYVNVNGQGKATESAGSYYTVSVKDGFLYYDIINRDKNYVINPFLIEISNGYLKVGSSAWKLNTNNIGLVISSGVSESKSKNSASVRFVVDSIDVDKEAVNKDDTVSSCQKNFHSYNGSCMPGSSHIPIISDLINAIYKILVSVGWTQ